MKNNGYDPGLIIRMPSALFATVLSLMVAVFSLNNWNIKIACALTYALALVISGWGFALVAWRIAGFIHAALMLGIAGFCFYVCLGNLDAPLGDNPAAGLIATATLIYFIVGTLSALFGIGITYLVLKKS